MFANGPKCAQKPLRVFHMYRREHRDQLSLKDFFLPFDGKLSGDNRWIKLAELIQWDDWKMTMQPSSARGLLLQKGPFRMALGP
jgi:hypothetical protein